MNLALLLTIAILTTLSKAHGYQSKQLGPCEGVKTIRDFSHCIKKRQACSSCSECESCNECNNCNGCSDDCNSSCQDCREYSGSNYQTNSQNNVDIQNRQLNENPHENKISVNLLNTVHNLNKINNPIEVENNNHFFYDQRNSQRINAQGNSSFVEVGGGYVRPPMVQPSCCGSVGGFCGTRTPMLLPPYMPPPPPCYYMQTQPYFGCHMGPAPVIIPACGPCFYCQGKYNPAECSKKKECKDACKKLLCGSVPCYPQIVSCAKDKSEEEKTEEA